MEEMIYSFFLSHGWKLTLIALSGIALLGVLKACNVFRKVEKEKRKYIYAAVSTSISILASAVYLVATGTFAWSTFGLLSLGIFGVNQAAYAVYETYGVRALFRKIASLVIQLFTKTNTKKSTQTVVDDLAGQEQEEQIENK